LIISPAAQDRCNSFPAGFQIVADFKGQTLSIHNDLDVILNFLESTENPELSPLQFVKVIDKIYTISREKTKELVDLKKQELSSLYKDLKPNTPENQEKLFLGYMQDDKTMAEILEKLEEMTTKDPILNKLIYKINTLIKSLKEKDEDKELNGLEFLNEPKQLFSFFAKFTLIGCLSSPKIELWPPNLGQTENQTPQTVSDLHLTRQVPGNLFKSINNPKSKNQTLEECIVLPTFLYYEQNPKTKENLGVFFVENLPCETYFFTKEEIEKSKHFNANNWAMNET